MARKLRLEFPGAIYHVINRGNYRADIFRSEGAKAAFEACLFAACKRSNWVLHAYMLMSNHYHLALETPNGNLVTGMQWLQATFANRFNRLRGERGHLFQGRYKALVVEEDGALGQVCHYIHLNPVRAGLVPVERLSEYRRSSYWYLWRPRLRPAFLHPETALAEAGGLVDARRGWQLYGDYLAWQAAEGPAGKNRAYVSLSRGWALGTEGFKQALIEDHALASATRAWEREGAQEIRAAHWERELGQALKILGRTEAELKEGPKSARWKVALGAHLKERTQVSNPWLAQRLAFDRAAYASRLVSALLRQQKPPPELIELRAKCTT
jgi:putative transposase